jgi:hypothetical protein
VTPQGRFGWFDYPAAILDRQGPEDGVFFIRNDDDLRAHILDDLSYMRDDPTDEDDRAEWDKISAMSLDDLVAYYLDGDNMIVPAYMPESTGSPDDAPSLHETGAEVSGGVQPGDGREDERGCVGYGPAPE